MRSFGKFITKYLASFAGFIIVLGLVNILAFGFTFYGIIEKDYGTDSPGKLLKQIGDGSTPDCISDEMVTQLQQNDIWAMFLDEKGQVLWSVDLPVEIPASYSIQDVAVFSKGYLEDYPVFVRSSDDGLLVFGYPKDSYTKITNNYYPISVIRTFPVFVTLLFAADLLLVFLAYYFYKRKIMSSTEPIVTSIESLSHGRHVNVSVPGDLFEVGEELNRASLILSKQNEARANWISGVSHDIRTPLSIIMGYADRISSDNTATSTIREQAEIIRRQSVKIKDLVQDLNLVSQLEYEMQPIEKSPVRLSKLLRSYTADLLNTEIPADYSISVEISSHAEQLVFECDARLISRAISNLVQNSIKHNPQGCDILIMLEGSDTLFSLSVSDNGIGVPSEKLQELNAETHYMESTDHNLNLRHGLGLLLVKQITQAHKGRMEIKSGKEFPFKTTLTFTKK